MRPAAALLLAVLAGAECQRAPPESFAGSGAVRRAARPVAGRPARPRAGQRRLRPTRPSPAGPPRPLTPRRCVLSTPAEPPAAGGPGPAPRLPARPRGRPGQLPVVRVSFPDAGGVAVDAELVRSEHDSMRGLMYRKSLGAERGMLFDLLVRDDHKFWMHNTCIPLDLLYVDEDGLVVGIVENAPTLNDESRGVGCPSRWVLEVNAGLVAAPRRQGRPAREPAR